MARRCLKFPVLAHLKTHMSLTRTPQGRITTSHPLGADHQRNQKSSILAGVTNLLSPSKAHPWWKALLASPARRFAADPEKHLPSRGTKPNTPPLAELQESHAPSPKKGVIQKVWKGAKPPNKKKNRVPGRKDLPKQAKPSEKSAKPSRRRALEVMKSKKAMKEAMESVENDYFANSSRVARSAKRHAVHSILGAAYKSVMPLSPEKLRALAGALRTSGYKSAHTYLAEAKLAHIEKGWDWTNLLDRHFRLCTKAVKRGVGPAKKAPEVAEDLWKAHPLLPDDGQSQGKVKWAPLLFACGVHWMMREIEIAALTSKNVTFDDKSRLVTLTWRESKMDQEGATISRTLQCLCSGSCDIACPYAVLEVLVNQAGLQGNEGAALSVSAEGTVATKAQLIADWRDLYGKEISGHSSRRTGALQYIRGGWSVSQVAFLGRWKSNVILEYAKEALQSIPLNADKRLFGMVEGFQAPQEVQDTNVRPTNQHQSNIELVGKLRAEIDSFMDGSKAKSHELDRKVQALEAKFEGYTKFLPCLVKSTRTQVMHRNNKIFLCSPSFMWKTTCGWSYYNSDYEFSNEEVTKVTCQKCLASAQGKEEEKQMFAGPPK